MMTSWQGETPLVKNVLKKKPSKNIICDLILKYVQICHGFYFYSRSDKSIRFQTKKWPSQEIFCFGIK